MNVKGIRGEAIVIIVETIHYYLRMFVQLPLVKVIVERQHCC